MGGIYLLFADYNENTDRYVLGYYEYSTRRIKDYNSTPYKPLPLNGFFNAKANPIPSKNCPVTEQIT